MALRNGAALASDRTLNEGQKDTLGKRPSSLNHKHQSSAPKSWRDVLKIQPAAELLPLISKVELQELGEDITKNGVRDAIALTSKRELLDGRNRLDAMQLVGLRPVLDNGEIDHSLIRTAAVSGDPYAYVISVNIRRPDLTAKQKRDLIAKLLKASPEKSNREIAGIVKASPTTVGTARAELERTAQIGQLTKTVGKDGKVRPSKKKRTVDDFKRDVASKKAAVAPAMPAEVIRDPVAPDEELELLREFARFVLAAAKSVSVDPKDLAEWKVLRGRVKTLLGAAS